MSLASITTKLVTPPLSHRFSVLFFNKQKLRSFRVLTYPKDIFFQKVSGLGMGNYDNSFFQPGGQAFTQMLPQGVSKFNLTMERGLPMLSGLSQEIENFLSEAKGIPTNILITLLDDVGLPLYSWLVKDAIPIGWYFTDLDADSDQVMIESLLFSYSNLKTLII